MTLLDHYFSFCAQVCEGACPTPAGITLTREDAMERAVELQSQITDISAFADVNKVYAEFFKEPYPSRSCVEVSKLPKGVKIEIDAIAVTY